MIALKSWPDQAESCCHCGRAFNGGHVCYWNRQRVCPKCHTLAVHYADRQAELEREWKAGERITAAATAAFVVVGFVILAIVVRICE